MVIYSSCGLFENRADIGFPIQTRGGPPRLMKSEGAGTEPALPLVPV